MSAKNDEKIDLIDLLKKNDDSEIQDFIIMHGKKSKQCSPIYFLNEERIDDNTDSFIKEEENEE